MSTEARKNKEEEKLYVLDGIQFYFSVVQALIS